MAYQALFPGRCNKPTLHVDVVVPLKPTIPLVSGRLELNHDQQPDLKKSISETATGIRHTLADWDLEHFINTDLPYSMRNRKKLQQELARKRRVYLAHGNLCLLDVQLGEAGTPHRNVPVCPANTEQCCSPRS